MPSFIDFLPLLRRTIDEIRTQVDTDANAGLATSDDRYVDTTVGGIFYDVTQGVLLEIERLWDFLSTEVPAAGLLPYAFGSYLDDWGDALSVDRKDEVAASGEVTFTAGPGGATFGTGTQVAVPSATGDEDPITFATTSGATIAAGGTATVGIVAVDPGSLGNVAAGQITQVFSPVTGNVTAVSNAARTIGGADVETDEAYRDRLLVEFRGAVGSGTVADYQRWALAEPGVGYASVEPIWSGPGTVRVSITDASNRPVAPAVVTSLQNRLDPVNGQGRGDAPIGHTVSVVTPTTVQVTVTATVVFAQGYSLDGANGTIALRSAITAALAAYIDRLAPGDDVILNRTESLFFGVDGVFNVSGVKLNGNATDLTISPTQVAQFAVPSLS